MDMAKVYGVPWGGFSPAWHEESAVLVPRVYSNKAIDTESTSIYSYARLAMVAFSRDDTLPLSTMRCLLYRLYGVSPQDPNQHLTMR